jgi:hypothetical protein
MVAHFKVLDRHALNDSPPTVSHCQLLLERVLSWLEKAGLSNDIPAEQEKG